MQGFCKMTLLFGWGSACTLSESRGGGRLCPSASRLGELQCQGRHPGTQVGSPGTRGRGVPGPRHLVNASGSAMPRVGTLHQKGTIQHPKHMLGKWRLTRRQDTLWGEAGLCFPRGEPWSFPADTLPAGHMPWRQAGGTAGPPSLSAEQASTPAGGLHKPPSPFPA